MNYYPVLHIIPVFPVIQLREYDIKRIHILCKGNTDKLTVYHILTFFTYRYAYTFLLIMSGNNLNQNRYLISVETYSIASKET